MFGKPQIAEAYLGTGSASEVAKRLNEYHRTDYFTVSRVLSVWNAQYLESPVLQQLGERPRQGFDQKDDRIQLAQLLLNAA